MAKQFYYIDTLFTDQVVEVGAVRRVYLHALVRFYDDVSGAQSQEWHYWGSLPTDPGRGPTTADPVFTHTYVSFPQDFDQLGTEAYDVYYNLGLQAGMRRDGVRPA